MKLQIVTFAFILTASVFSQQALADCKECASLSDSAKHLDTKKELTEQTTTAQESYNLLEKLSKTYGGKSKVKFEKEAVKPALSLILKLLKIDASQYAIEAAYPMYKTNKAIFEDGISSLPKDQRDEMHSDIETYENVLKNGNG